MYHITATQEKDVRAKENVNFSCSFDAARKSNRKCKWVYLQQKR